jgi:carbon storage regulator CsrA
MGHLVLSRGVDQRFRILLPGGEQISVAVLRLGHDVVRLGIEAPSQIQIWREELLPAVLASQELGFPRDQEAVRCAAPHGRGTTVSPRSHGPLEEGRPDSGARPAVRGGA